MTAQLYTVGVVNQPIEDAGYCRVADLFVPAGHRQLRRENQRAHLIAMRHEASD